MKTFPLLVVALVALLIAAILWALSATQEADSPEEKSPPTRAEQGAPPAPVELATFEREEAKAPRPGMAHFQGDFRVGRLEVIIPPPQRVSGFSILGVERGLEFPTLQGDSAQWVVPVLATPDPDGAEPERTPVHDPLLVGTWHLFETDAETGEAVIFDRFRVFLRHGILVEGVGDSSVVTPAGEVLGEGIDADSFLWSAIGGKLEYKPDAEVNFRYQYRYRPGADEVMRFYDGSGKRTEWVKIE